MKRIRTRLPACIALLGAALVFGCSEDPGTSPLETVRLQTPAANTGPAIFSVGTPVFVTVPAFQSSLGHPLEYQFDWDDGNLSIWGSLRQQHAWDTAGRYSVFVRARCVEHTTVISGWHQCLTPLTVMLPGPCSVYPSSIDFGRVPVGGPPGIHPVIFFNGGAAVVDFTGGTPCLPNFSIHPVGTWSLDPGEHFVGSIEFHPISIGNKVCSFPIGPCTDVDVIGFGDSR